MKIDEAWCPDCGNMLIWMWDSFDDIQMCYCGFCYKGFIAVSKEQELKK